MVSKFYTILFANKYIVIILRVDISIRRHSVKIFLRRNSLRYHTYADYILIQLRVSKQVIYILNPECFALKAEVWSELGGITSLYSLRSPLYPQGTKRYLQCLCPARVILSVCLSWIKRMSLLLTLLFARSPI